MNDNFVISSFGVGFSEVLKVNCMIFGFVLSDSFKKSRATFSTNEKLI